MYPCLFLLCLFSSSFGLRWPCAVHGAPGFKRASFLFLLLGLLRFRFCLVPLLVFPSSDEVEVLNTWTMKDLADQDDSSSVQNISTVPGWILGSVSVGMKSCVLFCFV